MKTRIPGAAILVYDNYNALAIGFGPNEKAGQAILSLAVMPRWVTLCFLWGVPLSDPRKLLREAAAGCATSACSLPTRSTIQMWMR